MIIKFQSFDDLLKYCKNCLVCGQISEISFELGDLPYSWFDLHSSKLNKNNVLKFCGIIFNNISPEEEESKYSTFEVVVPTEPGEFSVEAEFFPDSFEFFIEGFCNHCKSRRVATENILVDKDGLSNFNIETEVVITEKFCIEIHHDEEIIEIFDNENEYRVASFEISKVKFNLNNLQELDNKISKHLLIF